MPSTKLTIAAIERATVKAGEVLFLWDTTLHGFGLRVTSTVRAFVLQTRVGEPPKSVRITLGRHPDISLSDARNKAISLLSVPRTKAVVLTVRSLMQTFIENYAVKNHKPKTLKEERQVIALHLLPHLGSLTLDALTKAVVTEWHSDSGIPDISANRALAHLSKACNYAIARDWLTHNPCIGVERNKERARNRYLSDSELTELFIQLHKRSTRYHWFVALALTGLRVGELIGNFNFDRDRKVLWFIDSKTGSKSIPLNPEAYRFFNSDPLRFSNPPTYWPLHGDFENACLSSQIKGVSIHTLRHTLATYMAQHGDSSFQIAAMGGWRSLSMVQRYVTMHGVGEPHPTPAGRRIAEAIGLTW